MSMVKLVCLISRRYVLQIIETKYSFIYLNCKAVQDYKFVLGVIFKFSLTFEPTQYCARSWPRLGV